MNIGGSPNHALSTLTNQQQPAGAVRSNGHRSDRARACSADDLPEVSLAEMEEANVLPWWQQSVALTAWLTWRWTRSYSARRGEG